MARSRPASVTTNFAATDRDGGCAPDPEPALRLRHAGRRCLRARPGDDPRTRRASRRDVRDHPAAGGWDTGGAVRAPRCTSPATRTDSTALRAYDDRMFDVVIVGAGSAGC